MQVLGIDIGASGAIALLTGEGELLDVNDMTVLMDGPKGRCALACLNRIQIARRSCLR